MCEITVKSGVKPLSLLAPPPTNLVLTSSGPPHHSFIALFGNCPFKLSCKHNGLREAWETVPEVAAARLCLSMDESLRQGSE